MAAASFPDLATNLIYTVLCLVPGFITLKTALTVPAGDVDLDQFDKSTWSLVASGLSLSVVYFLYVAWISISRGQVALVVPVDLAWTELVAVYPVLLAVAVALGYVTGKLLDWTSLLPATDPRPANSENSE